MLKRVCSFGLLALLLFATSDTLVADDKAGAKPDSKTEAKTDAKPSTNTETKTSAESAPVESARLAAARKLMEITGSAEKFEKVTLQVIEQLQPHLERRAPKHKKAIGEVMSKMAEKFASRSSELTDQIAQLYAKKLPAEDLEAIIKFFSEGAGQRYVKAIPSLVQDSAALGQKWGQVIGREIQRDAEAELKKRGVRL